MALIDLINELQQATGPSRRLDLGIAVAVGYRRTETDRIATEGETVPRNLWLVPNGKAVDRVPNFTESIHQANLLAEEFSKTVAISWEPGTATAKVGDGPYCQAATPALALCIAILKRRFQQ